jgi:hypothetical protein
LPDLTSFACCLVWFIVADNHWFSFSYQVRQGQLDDFVRSVKAAAPRLVLSQFEAAEVVRFAAAPAQALTAMQGQESPILSPGEDSSDTGALLTRVYLAATAGLLGGVESAMGLISVILDPRLPLPLDVVITPKTPHVPSAYEDVSESPIAPGEDGDLATLTPSLSPLARPPVARKLLIQPSSPEPVTHFSRQSPEGQPPGIEAPSSTAQKIGDQEEESVSNEGMVQKVLKEEQKEEKEEAEEAYDDDYEEDVSDEESDGQAPKSTLFSNTFVHPDSASRESIVADTDAETDSQLAHGMPERAGKRVALTKDELSVLPFSKGNAPEDMKELEDKVPSGGVEVLEQVIADGSPEQRADISELAEGSKQTVDSDVKQEETTRLAYEDQEDEAELHRFEALLHQRNDARVGIMQAVRGAFRELRKANDDDAEVALHACPAFVISMVWLWRYYGVVIAKNPCVVINPSPGRLSWTQAASAAIASARSNTCDVCVRSPAMI